VSEHSVELPSQAAENEEQVLPWENLGAHHAWYAFRRTLAQLITNPRDFFSRMATSGGLHEPMTFFWMMMLAVILPSFPLALAYFGLTAPDPGQVSVEVYNAHLLVPRITGITTVLLPVALVLGGVLLVIFGSIYHAGAKWLGTDRWEGSVSLVSYAGGLGLLPVGLGACVCAVLCIAGYLATIWAPGAAATVGSIAWGVIFWGGLLSVIVGFGLFVMALIIGNINAMSLDTGRGVAASIVGLVFVGLFAALVPIMFSTRGWKTGLITLGICTAAAILSLLLPGPARWTRTEPAAEQQA